jgi:hypothetical protein
MEAIGQIATYIRLKLIDVKFSAPQVTAALRLLIRISELMASKSDEERATMFLKACLSEDPLELRQEIEFIMADMEVGK